LNKNTTVVFASDELERTFYALSENDPIKKSLKRAIQRLQENAFSGTQIPKRLIPQIYIRAYGIQNLWKFDLIQGWRLLYTVTASKEVRLITAILEWTNHKEYERRFNYRST
jgi:Txe/YoeB family toxin of Txe-Axe toxin-antitoxin module